MSRFYNNVPAPVVQTSVRTRSKDSALPIYRRWELSGAFCLSYLPLPRGCSARLNLYLLWSSFRSHAGGRRCSIERETIKRPTTLFDDAGKPCASLYADCRRLSGYRYSTPRVSAVYSWMFPRAPPFCHRVQSGRNRRSLQFENYDFLSFGYTVPGRSGDVGLLSRELC